MQIHIPMPLQLVIDDVGWWCGADGSAIGEPYRTGIERDHVPADYEAIASLGRELNIRPQAAMILCEWDRENVLQKVPTATWMGESWDNSKWVGPWLDEAAAVFRDQAEHIEFTLHGVGHEYWDEQGMTRAEWHDSEGRLRPKDQIRAHLDAFAEIMEQNDLGPFPESFVPCAFLHRFGLGEDGLIPILKEYGVKYMSTPWSTMASEREPEEQWFGVECGMMNVDRGGNGVSWRDLDTVPEADMPGPICGIHWPNLLHSDPDRNEEAVERWEALLGEYDERPDRVLSRDTAECWTQLAYHSCTELRVQESEARLDFTGLDACELVSLRDEFSLKVTSEDDLSFSADGVMVTSSRRVPKTKQYLLQLRREPGASPATVSWAARQAGPAGSR